MATRQIQHSLFPELPRRKPAVAVRRRPAQPLPCRRRLPLWMAVHLPQLALEALLRGRRPQLPQAVADSRQGVVRIDVADAAAESGGVRQGMTLAAAWSVLPELVVHERDPECERERLLRLAAWCNRFTPHVCIDGQTLLLEVRGSLRLFDGAQALQERLRQGLRDLNVHARTAFAPTPRAALWLAVANTGAQAERLEELPAVLSNLPLSTAGFPDHLLKGLAGIGARRIGDVLRLPRDGFARRYGARTLRELDQALGRVSDVRCPLPPARKFSRKLELLCEISEVERLLHPVHELLRELDDYLRCTQQGVSRIELRCVHRDESATQTVIGLAAATRDRTRIRDLVEQKLESFELPAPVLAVELHSREMTALAGADRNLFTDEDNDDSDWPQLVERLCMRLGQDAVSSVEEYPDHRPERAWRHVSPGHAAESAGLVKRPHWLLENPQPLHVREGRPVAEGPLRFVEGPERIEAGWWDEADIARDYYVAQDAHGRRLWICREVKSGQWWLQGLYG